MTHQSAAAESAYILAEAYKAAPTGWLRHYGRIDNRLRSRMRQGAMEALGRHEAMQSEGRYVMRWNVEQVLLAMKRVTEGCDPRGGTEREQMIHAMDDVARALADSVIQASVEVGE